MNILFGHDHVFYYDSDGVFYSGGGLPSVVWERYLSVFDSITVVGRDGGVVDLSTCSSMAVSSCKGVEFSLVKSVSTIKAKLFGDKVVRAIVANLVASHDAVIARLSSEIGLLLILEARSQGKPYAVELVDCPFDALWGFGGVKAKIYAPFFAWQVRAAMKKSLFSLYVTKHFLQGRYPSPNARTVDCSNVQISEISCSVIERRLSRLDLNSAILRIGLIGSLSGNLKGIETALRSLAVLFHRGIDFEFHVLGSGDPQPYIRQAEKLGISDKVYFDGVLPSGGPVLEWLDNIDIYIHPSLKEGLPRALIEAMSRGCPAVATNIAGTPELLSDSFLIQRHDYRALANKISLFIAEPATRRAQAVANFQMAKNYYADILADKRVRFWVDFARYVQGSNK
ncbi:glycosyltransferase [Ectopseudomonas mendocina]|uniref:Glycosyltransferase n=1 Tax=Ectopseudomonas mendocina TaxID=300 RepID=A0ABD7RNN0_ECTME|nr:glycosyltransferase family 4 protein [Pseudomonas mendocina]TRO10076.1 glycosyltransferase [Pseudomonas mendocina]TRO12144.1 glycosyltransferase [Pseudomonas mendocina]